MSDQGDTKEPTEVDEELSAAVVAYYSDGRSPFPKVDPDAVAALTRTRGADELIAAVRALDVEMGRIPVAWSTMTYAEGCTVAATEMAARHPELTPEAVATFDWHYSYSMR